MTTVYEYFGFGQSKKKLAQANELMVGLECEIESVVDYSSINTDKIASVEDGSLRNSGREFLVLPSCVKDSLETFKNLHATITLGNKEVAFSPRTSIHVHANCLPLDAEIVRGIIHRYALLEPMFFAMVNPDRRHNIHCVPLTETFLPKYYTSDLNGLTKVWHKYTALNVRPLRELGTIEFRHMQGHDNPELLKQWLMCIENLFEISKHAPLSPEDLTPDAIDAMFMRVFGHTAVANLRQAVPVLLQNNIIDVKMLFV